MTRCHQDARAASGARAALGAGKPARGEAEQAQALARRAAIQWIYWARREVAPRR